MATIVRSKTLNDSLCALHIIYVNILIIYPHHNRDIASLGIIEPTNKRNRIVNNIPLALFLLGKNVTIDIEIKAKTSTANPIIHILLIMIAIFTSCG